MSDNIKNAIIESVSLNMEDGRGLTVWVFLDYGGSGQGFGGYALQLPRSFTHYKIEGLAGHFITRCMDVAGVTDWDKMKGKTIRVKTGPKHDHIVAIGHIIKDDWFCPEEDFKAAVKGSPE